ncbi:MAG: hypothetical protein ACLQVX_03465 [Limisphaerales bacterium]
MPESVAIQADGKIPVGGWSTELGGQPRRSLGGLNNTSAATQNLSFDGSTIPWLRDGTSPTRIPLATNTLTSRSAHFSDPQWTNYPARFYRLRRP